MCLGAKRCATEIHSKAMPRLCQGYASGSLLAGGASAPSLPQAAHDTGLAAPPTRSPAASSAAVASSAPAPADLSRHLSSLPYPKPCTVNSHSSADLGRSFRLLLRAQSLRQGGPKSPMKLLPVASWSRWTRPASLRSLHPP